MSVEKANEQINSSNSTPGGKSNTKIVVIIASVVLICVIIGVILFMVLGKDSTEFNTVVTPDNVEEAIKQLKEEDFTPVGSYEVVMNTEWTFPDSASASTDAYVENCVNNQNTVFFTIAMDGKEDAIYTSPDLEVGSHLENIKLDEKLDAGVHDAVLTYHLVDDNHEEISHVSVSITLTIEK